MSNANYSTVRVSKSLMEHAENFVKNPPVARISSDSDESTDQADTHTSKAKTKKR